MAQFITLQKTILILVCCFTVLLHSHAQARVSAPPEIVRIVSQVYPDGVITEFEYETYRGEEVYEVEIDHKSGPRRLLISMDGVILSNEKRGELPLIGGQLSLGLGVRGESSPYKGVDNEIMAQPALIYRNGRFFLQAFDGINTSFDLFSSWGVTLALYGELSVEGFEASDSEYLTGMVETDPTFSMGFAASCQTRFAELELTGVHEVTGEHDGQEIEFSINKTFDVFSAAVTPTIGVEYQSSKVTDYYVGVSAAEARPGRAEYSPGSSLNFEAELLMVYPLFAGLDLVGIVEYTRFDSSISDSPIIEDDYEVSATFGLLYTF